MDFLIDERFFKHIKPYGIATIVGASLLGTHYFHAAFAYAYNKFSDSDEDEDLNPNYLN